MKTGRTVSVGRAQIGRLGDNSHAYSSIANRLILRYNLEQ
jgi:hypothetical protein